VIRNFYRVVVIVCFGGGVVWRCFIMKKDDELCEEPEELKCEGEGIVSGCKCGELKKDRKKKCCNGKY